MAEARENRTMLSTIRILPNVLNIKEDMKKLQKTGPDDKWPKKSEI